ncbi:MAG: pyridoxamine 5'-phosphate oxidase family protein [Dehalococcoidia bacterium]|nr:MAG: pyridoxamine 5'-phosphate oxidase family protein [Dehalococcoidia bacterium]
MRPLLYHAGQIEVQAEANSRDLADRMAHWVGPAGKFAEQADLLLFAAPDEAGVLQFVVVSGKAPLVSAGADAIHIPSARAPLFRDGAYGALAINLGEARRVRLNGRMRLDPAGGALEVEEAFTLCRKYLTRSTPLRPDGVHVGPEGSEPVRLDDGWVRRIVEGADTSFLASTAPGGEPDVAHRGGPAGFLNLDVSKRQLSWPEYVGDGVFKSAGNVRATGRMTLLVPDFETGDAVAIVGRAEYTNERVLRAERRDPLEQHRTAHPVQGYMRCNIDSALRLRAVMHPRERHLASEAINSASSTDEQAPR